MSTVQTSETLWERTAENLGSVATDLSKRPLRERLRLLPSFQSMYDRLPDRVAPGLREAEAERDRLQREERISRMRRRDRRAHKARSRQGGSP